MDLGPREEDVDNFYRDNEDLKFYVEKWIRWDPLVRLTEFDFRTKDAPQSTGDAIELYVSVLDMLGEFAAKEIAPKARQIDTEHPWIEDGVVHFPPVLENIFSKMKELEAHGMCVPRSLGGMNCPFTLLLCCIEMIGRGDVSVAAHFGFHGGMAMATLLMSVLEGTTEFDRERFEIKDTRFRKMIEEIVAGDAWGSMDITEPGAGSDMGAIRARGLMAPDGSWRVTGEKIFITSGHAKYHYVIARTEDAKGDDALGGLKGLSMFLVPAFEEKDGGRVKLARFEALEDKLGHHGSATVSVSYDETFAYLVGKRGEGFRYMLLLMNNARVAVGFESLGILEAAYRLARDYAAERMSMGKTIDRHEIIADYLDEMKTDIQGLRALAMAGAYHEETWQKMNLVLTFVPPDDPGERGRLEREMKVHRRTARDLTPLIKYAGAEKAVLHTRRAIQILGGYGYTTGFLAEKLLRDALVLPIYEGTSQIQALMAMKDNLTAVLQDPRRFARAQARTLVKASSSKDPRERRVARLRSLVDRTLLRLMARMAGDKFSDMRGEPVAGWLARFKRWDPRKDFSMAMLHAERLTTMLVDVRTCELLLEQARLHEDRADVLERYLERAEPRCRYLGEQIASSGKRLLATLGG